MAAKGTSATSGKVALSTQLKAAEKHWQQQKRKAREAKAAAKEAKKAVKRLRKLVSDANEPAAAPVGRRTGSARRVHASSKSGQTSASTKKLRIAGTPESRVRPARKKGGRPKFSKPSVDASEQVSAPEPTQGAADAADIQKD